MFIRPMPSMGQRGTNDPPFEPDMPVSCPFGLGVLPIAGPTGGPFTKGVSVSVTVRSLESL